MVKPHLYNKSNMSKDVWNKEGVKMQSYGSAPKTSNSTLPISKKSGLRRCGEKRWNNIQKSDLTFTPQEEELIIKLHAAIGSRWPIIAQQLPGRTDNDVKIIWNTKLRKKLTAMGIDPITHRPFSQILADYGNIGTFPKVRTRFNSLTRDLKNTMLLRSEKPQTLNPNNHNFTTFSNTTPNYQSKELSCAIEIQPFDLYSQLQAITTNATNYVSPENVLISSPRFRPECSSSSEAPPPASSFNWTDFLLEDAILGEQETAVKLSENVMTMTEAGPHLGICEDKGHAISAHSYEVAAISSSSSNSSFVDAMLEHGNDIFAPFPGLSEEPFYY